MVTVSVLAWGRSSYSTCRTHRPSVAVDERLFWSLLELVGEMFHDALRDRVRDRVDLGGRRIIKKKNIVPSFVKSCLYLFLYQGQVLVVQFKHVVLEPMMISLA